MMYRRRPYRRLRGHPALRGVQLPPVDGMFITTRSPTIWLAGNRLARIGRLAALRARVGRRPAIAALLTLLPNLCDALFTSRWQIAASLICQASQSYPLLPSRRSFLRCRLRAQFLTP